MTTKRTLPLAAALLLLLAPAVNAMPVGFDVGVLIEVSIPAPGWIPALEGPQWTATPLYGCTTTVEFNQLNQCNPPDRLICEKTVCLTPNFADPFAVPITTTTFSDDCEVCIETPECCDFQLPDPNDWGETETTDCSLTGPGVTVQIDHSLFSMDPPALDSAQAYQGSRSCNFAFDRSGGSQGPAVLEMNLNLQDLFLGFDDFVDPRADGFSQWSLTVTSPQLGSLFQGGVVFTGDSVNTNGALNPSLFEINGGGLHLLNDLVIPNTSNISPDIDHVDVQVEMAFQGRLHWDLDGSGVSDIVEMGIDPTLDEDLSGILDVCETFGGVIHAVGEGTLTTPPGADGEVFVNNIGSSGLDGVNIDFDDYASIRTEISPVPDIPPGARIHYEGDLGLIGLESAVACLVLDVVEEGRLRMTPNFTDLGDHELNFFVDSGNFSSATGFLEIELADGSGDTPWPTSVIARLVGNPPVMGFTLSFEEEVVVEGDASLTTNEPVQCFPFFSGPTPQIDEVNGLKILAQDVAAGFLISAATQEPPAACPVFFVRGDFTGDGVIGLADMVGLLSHLFQNGLPPFLAEAGDVNGDGVMGIADVLFGLGHLFGAGAAPPAPFPNPGCP